jgi:hypothetical protein
MNKCTVNESKSITPWSQTHFHCWFQLQSESERKDTSQSQVERHSHSRAGVGANGVSRSRDWCFSAGVGRVRGRQRDSLGGSRQVTRGRVRLAGGRRLDLRDKVGACDASLVGVMKDERAVSEEGTDAFLGGSVVVNVLGLEGVACDLSMLATVVSDLARFRLLGITWRLLATRKRVEVSKSRSTVAVVRYRVNVNVVGERSTFFGEVAELDHKLHALTRVGSLGVNVTLDISIDGGILKEGLLGESGLVSNTRRVVIDSRSILSNSLTGTGREKNSCESLSAHFE